jgi:RNA polymerase sigma-70 factor (ECF subfamily)
MTAGDSDPDPPSSATDAQADQRAIRAALAGDDRAFSDLIRRYTPGLFQFVCAMGNPAVDADDILQQTFLRAHANLGRYDAAYAFSTWLFTIARRIAINHQGRRRPDAPLRHGVPLVDSDSRPDPEQADESIWRTARTHLTPRLYEVLWLLYGEDLGLAGVARVMGITSLHARVLAHRARAKMSKVLHSQSAMPCPSPG